MFFTKFYIIIKDGDQYFFGVACCCLGFFSAEIILSSIAKDGYFLGFFFWLDLISTASLIFDIQWITNELFGTGGAASAQNATSLARASRASRIGTRAGRIVRIVRLIRLVKLYKHAQQVLLEKKNFQFKEEDEIEAKPNTVILERKDSKLNAGNYNLDKKDSRKKENTIISGVIPNVPNNDAIIPIVNKSNEVKSDRDIPDKIKKQMSSNDNAGNNVNVSKSREFGDKSGKNVNSTTGVAKDVIINNVSYIYALFILRKL